MSYTLFLSSPAYHRPPLSFPTRRSSDLTVFTGLAPATTSYLRVRSYNRVNVASDWAVIVSTTDRSEEHTSELQSPCNLVCRLLLVKKQNDQHELVLASAQTQTELS